MKTIRVQISSEAYQKLRAIQGLYQSQRSAFTSLAMATETILAEHFDHLVSTGELKKSQE